VHRIEELLSAQPGLEEQLFTARERAYCRRRRRSGEHLAARFAAKEAVLKTLGTGMGPRMRWTDIEIINERGGRPVVRLSGEVRQAAERLGMHQLDVSLTHTAGLAVAHAVLVCTNPEGAPVPAPV
jgi:holo-[acyl-carrier protein] synthase